MLIAVPTLIATRLALDSEYVVIPEVACGFSTFYSVISYVARSTTLG